MSPTCGALHRGKAPCGKPATVTHFVVLPLCKTHSLKLQAELRRSFHMGHKAGQSEYITKSLDETRIAKQSEQVYFIRAGRRVKIGFSANPEGRLNTIRAGICKGPRGLDTSKARIVALEPGGRNRELELHHQFAHLREAGEWFRGAPDLTAYIDQLAA